MARPSLYLIGSFQPGHRLAAESPIEAVWAHVRQLGITDATKALLPHLTPPPTLPWSQWGPYATVRLRQAVEFRGALHSGTLLTKPLPLYYSFLNLTRGILALDKQIISSRNHGMKFNTKSRILDCGAEVATSGTFCDYMNVYGYQTKKGDKINLGECLGRIVEFAGDYRILTKLKPGLGRIAEVYASAWHDGHVELRIATGRTDLQFQRNWKSWFPGLVADFDLKPDTGSTLAIKSPLNPPGQTAVSGLFGEKLLMHLTWLDNAHWHLLMETPTQFKMPREMYYFAAAFILGNIVRYEPEQLLALTKADSLLGWAIEQYIGTAERYFPQLMVNRFYTEPLIF